MAVPTPIPYEELELLFESLNLPDDLTIVTHGGLQPQLTISYSFSRREIDPSYLWVNICGTCVHTFNYDPDASSQSIQDVFLGLISFMCESSSSPPPFYNGSWTYHIVADQRLVVRTILGGGSVLARSMPANESRSIEALERVEASQLSEECAICLSAELSIDIKVCRTPCSHIFHEKCIVTWLEKSNACPLCRFNIPVRSILN